MTHVYLQLEKELRDFLHRQADGAWERERELFDAVVKYLILVNSGGVVVTLGIAGALIRCAPAETFFLPTGLFNLGIVLAGITLGWVSHRYRKRARTAYDLASDIKNVGDAEVAHRWNRFKTSEYAAERNIWIPVVLSFLSFIVGSGFGIFGLIEVSCPASTQVLLRLGITGT